MGSVQMVYFRRIDVEKNVLKWLKFLKLNCFGYNDFTENKSIIDLV